MTDTVQFQELPTADGRYFGRVILNAPRAMNALGLDMIQAIDARLDQWLDDPRLVAIWLEGAGGKALCAGGDVIALHASMVKYSGQARNPFVEEYFAAEYRLDYRLHTCTKPVIAWAEGLVMGGGMGLMQASDFRLVTGNSRLAMPEISIGLFPDVGASWFLNRLPGKTGLFLGLTGVHLNARDALDLGLADRFIDDDRDTLLQALLAGDYSDDDGDNHRRLYRALRQHAARPNGLDGAVLSHLDTINRLCDGADITEVVDNILACKQCDGWLDRARGTLAKGCPQTAHLVWQQLERGRHRSLAEVFRMEWCLAVQCGQHTDFREGVRALLIDKDGAPRFRHRSVAEVPAGYIDEFFVNPLPKHPLADL
ncbi:enoyl-CoA hydratase [Alcanivorax sp. N3-2A]|nr:enoyl-CoA hydratase [Alcanivorax sp. N3-2A]|tara:strand:- start:46864 stop:47970 length:1107 start_codon:yes stop_codon:yes gene_type:complete